MDQPETNGDDLENHCNYPKNIQKILYIKKTMQLNATSIEGVQDYMIEKPAVARAMTLRTIVTIPKNIHKVLHIQKKIQPKT